MRSTQEYRKAVGWRRFHGSHSIPSGNQKLAVADIFGPTELLDCSRKVQLNLISVRNQVQRSDGLVNLSQKRRYRLIQALK